MLNNGICETEFRKAVSLLWPEKKQSSQVDRHAIRSFKYSIKDEFGGMSCENDEFTSAMQFVVYANNLLPLFENAGDGEGTVQLQEFQDCASHFEIRNPTKAWKEIRKCAIKNLGLTDLSEADEPTVSFDVFCYYLSREAPFFDIELTQDEEM